MHVRDTCFKLYGYPNWSNYLKNQKGKILAKILANLAVILIDVDGDTGKIPIDGNLSTLLILITLQVLN